MRGHQRKSGIPQSSGTAHRQVVLDTETTGLEPSAGHRIIEIGCIEMIGRECTDNTFHTYLNPERDVDEGAVRVHGIRREHLLDKPKFEEIALSLLEYLEGAELIIHNAPFDVGFLNYEFKRVGNQFGKITNHCEVFDTLKYARAKHPGQKNNLDALCKRYKINNTHRELHGALLDSQILAQVFLAMTSEQSQLFTEATPARADSNNAQTEPVMVNELGVSGQKVVYASDDEVAAHKAYLEQMRESGSCLWVDD